MFDSSQFLGPLAALVLAIVVILGMAHFIKTLMNDFREAMNDVKKTCATMCDAFRSEAQQWREAAEKCHDEQKNLIGLIIDLKSKIDV